MLLIAILPTGCTEPDLQDLREFVAATKAAAPGKRLDPLPEIEPYRPFPYSAYGLRDPFALSEFVKAAEPPVAETGIRPDLDRPREELEKYPLGSLSMVGTLQRNGLWALIKAPDGIIRRVQVGHYLGDNYGRITAISEQRIDVTEIIPDPAGGPGWVERDNFLSLAK